MKRFIKLSSFLSILTLMLILSACGGSEETTNSDVSSSDTGSEEKRVLKLGHGTSDKNVWHFATVHFAEKVKEYSNGSIEVEIYPASQLGTDPDMIDSVQNGVLDIGYNALASFEAYTPVFLGIQQPFLIEDYDMGYKVLTSDVAAKALNELESLNMKGLAIVENGMRVSGTIDKPIRGLEDFKNVKMRASESGINLDIFQTLESDPTPIAYPEVYSALQTGVIEGQDQYLATWVQDKFWEVVDYISLTYMYTWPGIFSINLDLFNSLSPEQQEAVQKAAKDAQQFNYENMEQYDQEAIDFLESNGVEVIKDVNMDGFQEKLAPLYDKYAEKHPIVKETIEYIQSLK